MEKKNTPLCSSSSVHSCPALLDTFFPAAHNIGAVSELYSEMAAKFKRSQGDERIVLGLEAYLRRVDIISKAEETNKAVNDWDKGILTRNLHYKAVFAGARFFEALKRIQYDKDPFKDATGLQIRAFRSKLDDSVQHYRIFVPSVYNREHTPLPLIVVIHPIFSVQRPFIEGVAVADQENAEQWAQTAETLGMGILWVGYRLCPYGNPIEFEHLDEVLRAVERDYAVDYSRVSLVGECSAAIGACIAALRNPERYSAMFLLNPVLERGGNRFGDDGRFARFPAFIEWLKERDPLVPTAKLALPIWIVHDATNPAHGPLEHSIRFIQVAREMGKPVGFDRPSAPIGKGYEYTIVPKLRWLSEQRLSNSQEFKFRAPRASGPISEFFTDRFTVVTPSIGLKEDLSAASRLAQEFNAAWTKINFTSCRMVKDADLSSEEMQRSNLVLIGSPSTNAVWAKLAKFLPVSVRDDCVTVPGATIPIRNYGLQAWCSHPLMPGRKVLLIGGAKCADLKFGTLELEIDGWFDFAVWDTSTNHPRLLLADRYKIFQ